MPQFRLRRSRLRGSTSGRLRGNLGIASPVVHAGNAVAGVSPDIKFATHGNPAPRPRIALPMAGVTARPTVGILNVGAPVVVPGQVPAPRIVSASPSAPTKAAHAETRSPRVVGSVTKKPDPASGTAPDVRQTASAVPDVPEKATVAPVAPKPRIVGKSGRSK